MAKLWRFSAKFASKMQYRKTGNFGVVQFSRNFAVSLNPWKLKSAKYFLFMKN